MQPAYAITDLTAGWDKGNFSLELFLSNAFDRRAQLYRYSECAAFSPISGHQGTPTTLGDPLCGQYRYVGVNTSRTFGVRFGQKF